MTRPGRALFVGDIGLDTTVSVDHVPESDEKVVASDAAEEAGGVVANASVACRRAGASALLLCSTGKDPAGQLAVERVRAEGVEVLTTARRGATCRALILVERLGEKRLVLVPGVSMYPEQDLVRSVQLSDVGWVHTAAYDHAAATVLAERCRASGLPWSVDLEPATFDGDAATLLPILNGAAVAFVNMRAATQIGAEAASWLLHRGVQAVVLSQGAAGAAWVTETEWFRARPPAAGAVVDTTGAGDCLAGWFVAGVVAGKGPTRSLSTAVAAASLSCTRLGAQASYPDGVQVRRFTAAAAVPESTTS